MSRHATPVLPVDDLDVARRFYVHVLGCRPSSPAVSGRLDLELAGHPFALHARDGVVPSAGGGPGGGSGNGPGGGPGGGSGGGAARASGGTDDAASTLSVTLGVDDWCALSERLREHGVAVTVEPARRPSLVPGEQCALRLSDPDGNLVELRGFAREADQLAA